MGSVASLSSTGKFPLDESSEAANDKSEGKSPLKKNGKRNAKGTAHDTHNIQGTKRKFNAHEKETPNPEAMLNSVLSDTKDENQNLTGNHQQTQQEQQQEQQRQQQQKQQNHRNLQSLQNKNENDFKSHASIDMDFCSNSVIVNEPELKKSKKGASKLSSSDLFSPISSSGSSIS